VRRLDKELKELDPVDADAPEPSGEHLLARIVAQPYPPVPEPARRRLVELAPLGLAAAAVAAVLLVAGLGLGLGTDEREVPPPAGEVPAGADPDSILHYTQRWTFKGSGPATETETLEVWQAGDGSRQRVVYRPTGTATFEYREQVTTARGTREFSEDGGPRTIVEYGRSASSSLSAPAGYALPGDVGDPRKLPTRAAARERGVQRVDAVTVRGVPVERFRVGSCPRTLDVADAVALASASARRPVIVSLARDTRRPIRVETMPCAALNGMLGPPASILVHADAPHMPWSATDYVSFEVLASTPEHRRRLQMAPHPGARVVDSKALDRAEKRTESNRAALPTVTPTPAPR
jgi:hypothetical protein